MYCNHCGKQIGTDAVFCQYCGVRVSAQPAPAQGKRLMRSRRDRKIAGVCAGTAEYFGLDTTLVRVLWLLCVILGGTGLLAYLVAWIVIPDEPEYTAVTRTA